MIKGKLKKIKVKSVCVKKKKEEETMKNFKSLTRKESKMPRSVNIKHALDFLEKKWINSKVLLYCV